MPMGIKEKWLPDYLFDKYVIWSVTHMWQQWKPPVCKMQIAFKYICINIEMLWHPWMLLTQFQPLFHEKAKTHECRMHSPGFHRYFCWTCKELRKVKITLLDMELAMLLHSCYFWVSNLAAYKKCSHNQRDYMLKPQKGDPLLSPFYFTFKFIVNRANNSIVPKITQNLKRAVTCSFCLLYLR